MQKIVFTTVETHTLGEPTRIITSGFPDIPGITMMEKKEILEQRYDHLRRALMCEPRGHKDMVGALILPAEHTASAFGVVFMDAKMGKYVRACIHRLCYVCGGGRASTCVRTAYRGCDGYAIRNYMRKCKGGE